MQSVKRRAQVANSICSVETRIFALALARSDVYAPIITVRHPAFLSVTERPIALPP